MYRNHIDALILAAQKKEVPISGLFELTSRCNLRCGFCYVCDRENQVQAPPEKTTEEWLSLLREAVDMGLLMCAFSGGDPFMRDDFEEIYCKAYDMGIRVAVFTNGILIGKKQIEFLKKRPPDLVSISLYGASEETYRIVSGGAGNYRRTMESLDSLRDANLPFDLKVLAMQPMVNEYEALGCIAASYKCPGKFDSYMNPGRDDPDRPMRQWRLPVDKIMEQYRAFKKPLPPETKSNAEARGINTEGVFMCGAGKYSYVVTFDGRMIGCASLNCFTSYPFRDGFANAWQSLKDMIKNAEACEECATCADRNKCFICPADRLSECGSITICNDYLKDMVKSFTAVEQEA